MNALRAFEAAARHMSFSRAADELCVTQGAISRHIRVLEIYLGLPLFKRLTRAVELTEHGREYLPITRDAFDRIEQATLRIKEGPRSRVLTANVLPTFAMRWLIPRLPNFTLKHPDIEVRMITSIHPVNFLRDDVDVAIRVGMPPDAESVSNGPRISLEMVSDWGIVNAEKLMPDILVPVCSPSLLNGPKLETPADVLGYPLLHNATRGHAWPDWLRSMGLDPVMGTKGPAFGHFFMVMQAAMEGRGIALIPEALAGEDLATGRLIVALDRPTESSGSYYVLCRRHQRNQPSIRSFREWLFAERDL
jgi:LysR family glycine cleavage system transcriptional activator